MGIFELNNDVLEHWQTGKISSNFPQQVISYICMPPITSTIRLSRAPYHLMPYRLPDFRRFILADLIRHISYLRHFSFHPNFLDDVSDPHSTSIGLLTDVLDLAQNLPSFDGQNCERIFLHEPHIPNAALILHTSIDVGYQYYGGRDVGPHSAVMVQQLYGN